MKPRQERACLVAEGRSSFSPFCASLTAQILSISHSRLESYSHKDYCLVGCEAVQSGSSVPMLQKDALFSLGSSRHRQIFASLHGVRSQKTASDVLSHPLENLILLSVVE